MQGGCTIDKSLLDIDLQELYVEIKPFSKGAYSKVYKAKYKDAKVCVKVISKSLAQDDPNFAEYVEREISLLKSVHHSNLLEFYGAAEDDEDFYVVTEYVSGGNIRQYLQTKQELSWDLRIHIAVGVAQGLGYLHSVNIIHRDIKSENFLVGDAWQIKVCDLGFARRVESLGKKRSMSICGTEEYMCPEIMVGLDYNEKVDIFSFGIFLVELITQCYLPTDFKRTAATQFGIDTLKLKDMVPPDCPAQLMDLVLDCCNFSAYSRPDFEKIVCRLLDIQALLPHFSIPAPLTYEYFEEVNVYEEESQPSRSRAAVEEIKYKEVPVEEYFIDEAEDAMEYEEITFKEVPVEYHTTGDCTPQSDGSAHSEKLITPLFHSMYNRSNSKSSTIEASDDEFDGLKTEEISLVNMKLVEIHDDELANEYTDFDNGVVTRNEKYSYYYNK